MFTARVPVNEEDAWAREELALTQILFSFLTEIAAARSWSECMYRVMLPQLVAGVLHENPDAAQGIANKMRRITQTVLDAEKVVGNQKLATCLQAAAWHKLQLARELMKMGQDVFLLQSFGV